MNFIPSAPQSREIAAALQDASHIRQFIAGAAIAGLSEASSSVEARSLARPCAALARRSAVAGATTIKFGLPAQLDMAHFGFVGQREQILVHLVFAAQGSPAKEA